MEVASRVTPSAARGHGRPVMLATLGVPFERAACVFAVDAAVEAGEPLIVVNAVELPPLAMSVRMGYDQLPDTDEEAEALKAPAELAFSLGVEVERLRVRSPRPVSALLEVVGDRRPGVLVFGPDRSLLRRRAYRRAAKAVRERASCLVWLPD